MEFNQIIKLLREKKDITAREIAEKIGVSTSAYLNYERGERQPNFETLCKIADYYDVSVDYLLGRTEIKQTADKTPEELLELEPDHEQIRAHFREEFEKLPELLQSAFCQVLKNMYDEGKTSMTPDDLRRRIEELLTTTQKVSAGTGFDLTSCAEWAVRRYDVTGIHRKQFRDCYVVQVEGVSMEPKYLDGDFVLVLKDSSVEVGEVGIFRVGTEGYIKQLREDGLHSINPECDDVDFEADMECCGKVLGTVKPAD